VRSTQLRATWLEHDPEELALDVVEGWYRFSEKIMLNQKPRARSRVRL